MIKDRVSSCAEFYGFKFFINYTKLRRVFKLEHCIFIIPHFGLLHVPKVGRHVVKSSKSKMHTIRNKNEMFLQKLDLDKWEQQLVCVSNCILSLR